MNARQYSIAQDHSRSKFHIFMMRMRMRMMMMMMMGFMMRMRMRMMMMMMMGLTSTSRSRRGAPQWLLNSTLLLCLLLVPLSAHVGETDAITIVKAPPPLSSSSSATFAFVTGDGTSFLSCTNCGFSCRLDNYNSSKCTANEVSYTGLADGGHMFEVCVTEHQGVQCASYFWTIDTTPPTAYVSTATPFTNALNVSVHVFFTEPCPGGGGFQCSSNDCNLLVYGAGRVLPSTLKILDPYVEFSLVVSISADIQFGRLILAMDKNICTDAAGNRFARTPNSNLVLHFDRRPVLVNLRTHIPEKQLQLNGAIRTAEATNNNKKLRIYFYFSAPVLNSSAEILAAIHSSTGLLFPTKRSTLGNRRFGYTVQDIPSTAVVTISCDTTSIISKHGTSISPSSPLTFLYDTRRPSVKLATSKMRTRERTIPVLIKFGKPVFGFNSSAILISGGHLLSFRYVTMSMYAAEIHADDGTISVEIPENSAMDIAGNKNVASRLQVWHYSVPILSSLFSSITTTVYLATSFSASVLAITTASLLCSGAFSRPTGYLISEPSRSTLRIASHIQIFAMSKWLVPTLPVEYFEFLRGIEWSIPYLNLPWETGDGDILVKDSRVSFWTFFMTYKRRNITFLGTSLRNGILEMDSSGYGSPLAPQEYKSFLENQDMKPEAEFITVTQSPNWWIYFGRNMFWLVVIGGGLMLLHATILLILKLRTKNSEKQQGFGALVFPRFEIFLISLALPCICQASTTIIRGGTTTGIVVGVALLILSSSILLSMFLFLSIGITMGKLLHYKEVHQEGQEFHWYQEIVRVTLGPGKQGQWNWKDQSSSYLTKLGPLFEDLRGPPKYMLTQITGGESRGRRGDRIIASEDETEDSEAPFIQKLFGILRIYYTLLEIVKRVSLGIVVGAYYSPSGTSSKVPTLVVLSITSFQLFFLLLKKPFIKKKVQFVEIICVASEVCIFLSCLILLEKKLSVVCEKRLGLFMLALFVVGFTAQILNEWYALYRQVIRLSPTKDSFISGLKRAAAGLLLILLPRKLLPTANEQNGEAVSGATSGSPGDQNGKISGTSEKSWLRQLSELAKASFSRDERGTPSDPSSSNNTRSTFWSSKRSGSSSVSADSKAKAGVKAKSKGLYKDLEDIFSSK